MKTTKFEHYIQNRHPILRPSYCIFADLLGLKKLIAKYENDSRKLLQACQSISDLFDKIHDNFKTFSHQFLSDSFVIGEPIENKEQPDHDMYLGSILMGSSFSQIELVLSGFPIRGGLSFGDLHISPRLAFGPSLLSSYFIEKEHAKFPRIVVANSVLDRARKHLDFYAEGFSPHHAYFWIDETDGHVFINYLQGINEDDFGTNFDLLNQHKKFIENSLKTHEHAPREYDKYAWMRDYHNEFCRNHCWQISDDENEVDPKSLGIELIINTTQETRKFKKWRGERNISLPC